jgi:hypothetical protein
MLTSGSIDGTIVLWDPVSRLPLGRLPPEHQGRISGLAFTHDGAALISGSDNGKEKVIWWDISGEKWRARACELAGRNLTDEEWRLYVHTGPPQPTCPHPFVRQAVLQARDGDRAAAEATFVQAVSWASGLDDPLLNNKICWQGSLEGFASVIMPACERAESTAPRWMKEYFQDSHALALALTGDLPGASKGFRSFVTWAEAARLETISDEMIAKRKRWIKALDAGQNPFDAETIRDLRLE